MSVPGSRSRVTTRDARPADLPAVLTLVRQHRAEAHAEGVLTGQTPGATAAAGFRRLLADPAHRVVLAVLPGPNAPDGGAGSGEVTVGLAVLGVDPLSVVRPRPEARREPASGEEDGVLPQVASSMQVRRAVAVPRPCSSVTSMVKVASVRPRRTGVATAVTTPSVAALR